MITLKISGRHFRDFESTIDRDLENFLMHFSTGILTLNTYYSLQKNILNKTSLMGLINFKNA